MLCTGRKVQKEGGAVVRKGAEQEPGARCVKKPMH